LFLFLFLDKTGKTSLQWAVDHNFIDIAKLLLAHGAVLNHRDKVKGYQPSCVMVTVTSLFFLLLRLLYRKGTPPWRMRTYRRCKNS